MCSPEIHQQMTTLVDTTRALSGLVTLLIASTPTEEFSEKTTDALVTLAYQVTTNLEELDSLINPEKLQ